MGYSPKNAYEFSYASMGDDRYGYEGSYAFSPSWQFGGVLHCHDFYEIYFARTEGVCYLVEGHRFRVGPGRMLIIAPGQVHSSTVSEPSVMVSRQVSLTICCARVAPIFR